MPEASNPKRRVMGGIDLAAGALLLVGTWIFLPVRWAPADVVGTLLGLGFVTAGGLLFTGHARATKVAKVVAAVALVVGLLLVAALAYTAGSLRGMYGPVGQGGSVILFVAALLFVPYLVVFPAAQLYALLPREAKEST
ncbi:MAG: hypothetical protein H6721_22370 [Sandaracinus sp.]|nr:hypothetical protein [Sandaracinus sp.]